MKFEDINVVITGGLKGIGKACADYFLKEGAKVACWGTSVSESEDGTLQENGKLFLKKVDVSDEQAVKAAAEASIAALGEIHHLIQSAGMQGAYTTATEISMEEWNRVMGVNLTGCLFAAKYLIPSMQKVEGAAL